MYYYRRKTSPLKWVIIIIIIIGLVGFGYWYYINYFSKIDFSKPEQSKEQNQEIEALAKILAVNLDLSEGNVSVNIADKGYQQAVQDTVLHQGDKIMIGAQSQAILKIENGSIIRLGENTELTLQSLDEKNILIEVLKGRIYNNLTVAGQYQVKYNNSLITATGTKFEAIINDSLNYLAVLDFENSVKVEILGQDNLPVLSAKIEPNEKALVDLKAAKKDILKIDNFDQKVLAKENWYKWNFDLDSGLETKLTDQEPDYEEIQASLVLSAEVKEAGIYLSWSIYDKDNFKNYKIIRSETNADLKFPDTTAIKSSADIELNSYLDTQVDKGKKYYYRICAVKQSNKIACGNVATAQTQSQEQSATAPAAPSLMANISDAGVALSWTQNSEEDFKEYRILKSFTNPEPTFPAIGYLAIRNKGVESYLDKEVNITSVGNIYYRVCSFNTSGNSACSNVATITNGQVK
ncbi:MAG: FecR domain-containing protein [Patescibacteria group bacterium]